MGDCEGPTPVGLESTVEYHPECIVILTFLRNPEKGQCLAGSLTGVVAS